MSGTPLFIGIAGTVLALDRATGQEIWRAKLKSSDFVNVVLDNGELYGATAGELFALDPATGQIRWHNQLKGLGRGLVTVASAAPGGLAVFDQKRRRDQEAAAAATAAAASG